MVTNIEFEITPIEEATRAILESVGKFFLNQDESEPLGNDIESMIEDYLVIFKDDLYCLTISILVILLLGQLLMQCLASL